jgi:hypothetical protein
VTGSQTIENPILYRINETTGALEAITGVFDPVTRTVSGQTIHFSPFFVGTGPRNDDAAGAILLDNSGAPQYTWRNVCPYEIIKFYYPPASVEGAASVSPDSCTSGWCNQIKYILPQGQYRMCVETWSRDFQMDLPKLKGHTNLPDIVDVHKPFYYNDMSTISQTLSLGNMPMQQSGGCDCPSLPDPTTSGGTGDLTVTLVWHSSASVDLDLWVTEPNGNKIYWDSKTSSTGGQLDLDNWCDNYSAGRPENIFWGNPPAGDYKIEVNWYEDQTGCSGSLSSSPYEVRVVNKGVTKTYTGTISTNATINVATVTVQ